jgi:hypothetical protein
VLLSIERELAWLSYLSISYTPHYVFHLDRSGIALAHPLPKFLLILEQLLQVLQQWQ